MHYKPTIVKTVWYWHKARHIDQWSGTDSPEINLYIYGQLVFDKGARSIQRGKDRCLNRWCWDNWIAIY